MFSSDIFIFCYCWTTKFYRKSLFSRSKFPKKFSGNFRSSLDNVFDSFELTSAMTVIDQLIKYHKNDLPLLKDGGISIFAMLFQRSPLLFKLSSGWRTRPPKSFRMNNQLYIFQNNSCETIFFLAFLETFNMITNLWPGCGWRGY